MLSTYLFGQELCKFVCCPYCVDRVADFLAEEPEFASALQRFYGDVIACMGALQVVPSIMAGWGASLLSIKHRLIRVALFIFSSQNEAKH